MHHARIPTNGLNLHVVQAGPEDGPLLLLLHGFPEFWHGWRYQIPALAEAGYRVWVPDQRGYNRSDKPEGIGAYTIDKLARDVTGLIEAAGQRQAYVVGHDWGAAVAWWMAAHVPDVVRRMVVINVPHPAVMGHHLRHNLRQVVRSWYMGFFQLPRLPEAVLRTHNWRPACRAMQRSSRPGTFTDDDLARYQDAWSQPGAMTAMINWYRAAFRPGRRHDESAGARTAPAPGGRITVPTLLIWGARDRFLGKAMAQPSIERCAEGRLVMLDTATHWVHHEEPEQVATLIRDFFTP
jgi:pimeloyl-ACP methyl ester carboxylesterase